MEVTYIWINPVVEQMYEEYVLDQFLKRHGLERVRCRTDWGRIVKEKYIRLITEGGETVMDARCPMACGLVKEWAEDKSSCENSGPLKVNEQMEGYSMKIADIEPILIHCAREICSRQELKDGRKIITTPCQALADMGNSLKLYNTRFFSWNSFLETLGERPEGNVPEFSPIPPGFFRELGQRTMSLPGRESIEQCVQDGSWQRVRLVEMLYCRDGCHNGDGVVTDEA